MKLQVPFVQLPLQFDADVLSREVLALGAGAWRPQPGAPGRGGVARRARGRARRPGLSGDAALESAA
jgi:hypothetical protein